MVQLDQSTAPGLTLQDIRKFQQGSQCAQRKAVEHCMLENRFFLLYKHTNHYLVQINWQHNTAYCIIWIWDLMTTQCAWLHYMGQASNGGPTYWILSKELNPEKSPLSQRVLKHTDTEAHWLSATLRPVKLSKPPIQVSTVIKQAKKRTIWNIGETKLPVLSDPQWPHPCSGNR